MSDDAFAPAGAEARPVGEVPPLRLTRAALWFCGVVYGLLAVTMAPMMYFTATLDPELPDELAVPMGLAFAAITVVIGGGFAVANVAAAIGLAQGKRWAWLAAMVLGAMYAPSACLPLGAVMLWELLQDDTRKAFLD